MKSSSLLLLLIMTFFIQGCAQKVSVKALEPAEISAASQTKNIAVTKFYPDYVNLTDKVEAAISKQRIDGNSYFRVINRSDFNKVIKEQKLQNSGLVNESTAVEVGSILGAQAIISGSVDQPTLSDSHYYEERTKCRGKGEARQCWKIKVSCLKRSISLTAQIRMINVKTSAVIFADNIRRQQRWSRCADDSRTIPSKQAGAQYLANNIANNFAYRLTPHYQYLSVTLLEDPDMEYTDLQERLLENALLYIEQSRYDKAEQLLSRLIESTDSQSYVALYDLGVIYEARGDFIEAQHYYDGADKLTIEPVEEINLAVNRIQRLIRNEKTAQAQIAQ